MATLKNTTINDTGYITVPSGTIAQRPAAPTAGMYRYNTDLSCAEYYNGTNWINPVTGTIPIVTSGLSLYLDAADPRSCPSSTTSIWYDLSGNGYHFTIAGNNFGVSSGIPYMDFSSATYGMAKRVVGGALTDVPSFSNVTVVAFTSILASTADWRTFLRSAGNDHQVIVQAGYNNLGMYDNDAAGFLTANFDVTTLPNYSTQFNCLIWKLSTSSPYYSFQYNANATTYTITNASATYTNGFSTIGGYHSYSTAPLTGGQFWGKISAFLYYNKHLSAGEITQTYNAFKSRYGI